ncbi:glycoside hydrolase family 61 protein [Moniliophthora roreri]|nr:glycoside hydrolase family 61 protein [Moniliophthora roreri]
MPTKVLATKFSVFMPSQRALVNSGRRSKIRAGTSIPTCIVVTAKSLRCDFALVSAGLDIMQVRFRVSLKTSFEACKIIKRYACSDQTMASVYRLAIVTLEVLAGLDQGYAL